MRLTEQQIQAIKHTAHAVLGEGAHVTLFGSRVDDRYPFTKLPNKKASRYAPRKPAKPAA